MWLSSTKLVDPDNPKLWILTVNLTQVDKTQMQDVLAIHGFIKAMPFGCASGFGSFLLAMCSAVVRGLPYQRHAVRGFDGLYGPASMASICHHAEQFFERHHFVAQG